MAEKFKDQEFLEYVVTALVDVPEAVKVERKVDEMGVLLSLSIDSQDMGKIIGRNGNTAKAIRNLLRVVGLKNQARVNLKIEEPEGGRASAPKSDTRSVSDSVDDVVGDLKL
ncbi:MAG: KH domain-containing protein [Candidatus Marinimicrobia bacterium]|nr:KH domain-containing protein [Candidatus Neomarinimicrobiota bacterium]